MTPDELKARVGQEIGVSRWITVDQARIDAFSALTEDPNPIHTDAAHAATTPMGTTIAHGFLTLSLLAPMAVDVLGKLAGQRLSLNYGLDRLRFVSPVPSGARIRGRFTLVAVEERAPGEFTLTHDVTAEVEGSDRPALVARWIERRYVGAGDW